MIVLPYGDQHQVGGTADVPPVPIATLFAPPPWDTLPVLRYGAGGPRTDIVCGYLHSVDPLFDPRLGALPRVFVVRMSDGPLVEWVRSSIEYALALSAASLPAAPASTRLPEVLLTEHGWIGALRDPCLAPALAAIHGSPARKWSVADLAAESSVSRSVLDERFGQVLGRSPIRYLTEWRMHVAGDLLRSTDLGAARVAREVGYDAEESFNRAFKRHHGQPPGRWRDDRLEPVAHCSGRPGRTVSRPPRRGTLAAAP